MQNFIFMLEIIFADSTSIWLFDNSHGGWFHNQSSNPLSIDKHSGKVRVWAGVSMLHGKISMTTFRENLTGDLLSAILEEEFLNAANYCYPEGWVLQMDNDPKNTSGVVQRFVRNFVPYAIDWLQDHQI